jgi:hypothetical protein
MYTIQYESAKRSHAHAQNTHTHRSMPKVLAKAVKALVAEVTVLVQRDQRGVVQQLLSLLRLPCQCPAQWLEASGVPYQVLLLADLFLSLTVMMAYCYLFYMFS